MMRLISCWPEAAAQHRLCEPYKMARASPRQPAELPPRPKPFTPIAPKPRRPTARPTASSLFADVQTRAAPMDPVLPGVLERPPPAFGKDQDAWRQLKPPEKEAAHLLGFNEWTWDNGLTPDACARSWRRLDPHMQAAAVVLGYDEASWADAIPDYHESQEEPPRCSPRSPAWLASEEAPAADTTATGAPSPAPSPASADEEEGDEVGEAPTPTTPDVHPMSLPIEGYTPSRPKGLTCSRMSIAAGAQATPLSSGLVESSGRFPPPARSGGCTKIMLPHPSQSCSDA